MCLQLNMSKIAQKKNVIIWSEKSCKIFRKLARSDMPIECRIIRHSRNVQVMYNDLPHTWPEVFEVTNLVVVGSDKSIELQMFESGDAVIAEKI